MGGGELQIDINPHAIHAGGFELSQSALTGSIVVLLLMIGMGLIASRVKHFSDRPKGLQAVVELAVDSMHRFAQAKIGRRSEVVAPFVMTLMMYILFGTLIDLFGIPAVTMDLNATAALALLSFLLTNIMAFSQLGFAGRFKHLAKPIAVAMPIRILTDLIAPCSMALRLFANVLVGAIIIELVYFVCPLVLPAVVGAYFSVIHPLIQVYVFGLLSLNYIEEAIE